MSNREPASDRYRLRKRHSYVFEFDEEYFKDILREARIKENRLHAVCATVLLIAVVLVFSI
jgi:hypothetical protein